MGSDTRERILATAARLFTEQGYDGTSLREISDSLGVTKAALYYHFRAKEDILAALIQPFVDSVEGLIDRLEKAEDVADWAAAIDWVITQMIAHAPEFTLLQRNRAAIETMAHQELFSSEHQQMHERIERAVAQTGTDVPERIRMVAALGAVTGFDDWAPTLMAETDAEELAGHLSSVVHGILGIDPTAC